MSSIVINPKDDKEMRFISELLQKLNVDIKIIPTEELEDLGLSLLMKEVDRNDIVSEEEVMSKLKS